MRYKTDGCSANISGEYGVQNTGASSQSVHEVTLGLWADGNSRWLNGLLLLLDVTVERTWRRYRDYMVFNYDQRLLRNSCGQSVVVCQFLIIGVLTRYQHTDI